MDWGIRNRYGYLATSLPRRYRLLWSAAPSLVLVACVAWFGGLNWMHLATTFAISTLTCSLMASVTDLAARNPVAGLCIAVLSGTGGGALWWALTGRIVTIWMATLSGVAVSLWSVYSFADLLRSLGAPSER